MTILPQPKASGMAHIPAAGEIHRADDEASMLDQNNVEPVKRQSVEQQSCNRQTPGIAQVTAADNHSVLKNQCWIKTSQE